MSHLKTTHGPSLGPWKLPRGTDDLAKNRVDPLMYRKVKLVIVLL